MPQTWINFRHVKEHASFEVVLEHYGLESKGRGDQRSLLCPFHAEAKPSCKVNVARNVFHCFGCGKEGNILDFVQLMEDSDLRTAAMKLAEICALEPAPLDEKKERRPDKEPEKTARQKKKDAPARARTKEKKPEQERVSDAPNPPLTFELKLDPDHTYLDARDIPDDVREEFGIGFCSRGLMKDRICFPIHDEAGTLVAYAGRWAADPVPDDTEKYLLPPKFQKSRVLYNLHRLSEIKHLVVVESYWSVLRLHRLGVPVVSPMGSSISEEQAHLLAQAGARFIAIMFDGDEAGRRATEAALPLLAPQFFVHAAELPDGEKPHTVEEAALEALVRQP